MADPSEANLAAGEEDAHLAGAAGAEDQTTRNDETINPDDDDVLDPDNQDNEDGDVVEDTDEVDVDGKKYMVPKAIKDSILRHADYTKKTMELADQRKATDAEKAAIEAERSKIAERVVALDKLRETQAATIGERIKLQAADDEIAIYGGMTQQQWSDLQATDPHAYQQHRDRYTDLRLNRSVLADQLATKEKSLEAEQRKIQDAQALETQQATARRLEEGRAVLARDIPDWGPETKGKLVQFGQGQGFTAEEIGAVEDPRLIKLLHLAMTGSQSTQQRQAVTNIRAATAVQPARTVGGGATPVAKSPEKMSMEEWVAAESARMARKAQRKAGR